MKKVLFINDFLSGGGTENSLGALTEALADKFDITVLTIYRHKDPYLILDRRIKYKYLFLKRECPDFLLRQLRRVRRRLFIAFHRYDIAVSYKEGPCAKLCSKIKSSRKFAWIHADFSTFHWTDGYFKKGEEKRLLESFDKVIAVSEKSKDGLVSAVRIEKEKISVIPNIIDKEKIEKLSKEKVNIKKPEMLLLSIGRLDSIKCYDGYLEICRKLWNEGYHFEVWLVGDGPMRSLLKSYIDKFGLINVKLIGNIENPYPYLKMADWFVHPSHSEGFGIVLAESAVLHVPILSTDCGIAREVIGENGGIVVNDDAALEMGLRRVLQNKELKKDAETYLKEHEPTYDKNYVAGMVKKLFEAEDI
ncbi:MAG: glycosyltransferase [Bacillota bacterium]|nr:glycosyltransferase [Bacillota bacterium]